MSSLPILLVQLRRLGDLIMTFPLLASLRASHPSNPILFVGEELFYKDLRALVPGVNFLPSSRLDALAQGKYELILNLDSHPKAARCAAAATANLKIGPQLLPGGGEHIESFWQLYRASLTQNNRHNLFHWGDLNRLDLEYPLSPLPRPQPSQPAGGRIGLFIGASEAAKRPGPDFWAVLARLLLAAGYKPLILGGSAEKEAGAHIASRTGLKNANFCGRTNLTQLASLLASLDLLITPDTGPMHLADWLGVPVFNLSMGNVHAAETGPMRPGQLLMRAQMSCAGCWQCSRGKLYCHNAFNPALVARIAQARLREELPALKSTSMPADLLLSGRDDKGLYTLSPLFPTNDHMTRDALDRFWQSAFLFFDAKQGLEDVKAQAKNLAQVSPFLVENIQKNIKKLLSILLAHTRNKNGIPPDLWKNFPRHSSLFAGFIEMRLQNGGFSRTALSQALELTAQIGELFTQLP